MVITPSTDLYLVKVPLEISQDNQLTFANATAQYNYFSSLPRLYGDGNFTYQRKDGVIRFGALIDDIMEYNYVMYRNDAHSDKWFYAFITNMEYASDGVTFISIKTDVWQTYQFQLNYKPVLIDREHANTDVAGDNTLPEQLELGEFVTNGDVTNFGGATNYCTVIEVSQVENEGDGQSLSYEWDDSSTTRSTTPRLNDTTRGTTPLVIGITGSSTSGSYNINGIRDVYDLAGLGDAIVNVYMIPSALVGTYHELSLTATRGTSTASYFHIAVPDSHDGVYTIGTSSFTKPTSIDGYIPKCQKLLTYPFCFFNISNNAGTSSTYRYEDFSSTISFDIEGTFGASGSTKAVPQNYKNIGTTENGYDYSVSGAKYPICSWKSDSYTNWLTQNAVNMDMQWINAVIGGGASIIGNTYSGYSEGRELGMGAKGAGMGFAGGAIQAGANLISTALNQHVAKTQANLVPDQVKGNLNAGDVLWAKYKSPFTFLPMSVKAEYARCIDEFFSQYGYKCNRVKLPNITGRRNWNYVKTIGCYIEADIPQDDLQEIKSMFDRGITFWHNPATFADYTQSNDIV